MPKRLYTNEERYAVERIMAAGFIAEKIGYNYQLNKLILKRKNIEINTNIYTNTMTAVIRNVYRKIQDFINYSCNRKITPISVEEFNLLRSPLIQARQWLYQNQLETFFKFVRLTYNIIGDTDISVEKANILYGQFILVLEKQMKVDAGHLKKKSLGKVRKNKVNCYSYRIFQQSHRADI